MSQRPVAVLVLVYPAGILYVLAHFSFCDVTVMSAPTHPLPKVHKLDMQEGSRTAWVVSIVPWRRTPWVIAQMWRGTDGGSRRSLPNQSRQLSDYRTLVR